MCIEGVAGQVLVRECEQWCLIGAWSLPRLGGVITEAARVAAEAAKRDLKIQSRALSVTYGKITDLKPKVSQLPTGDLCEPYTVNLVSYDHVMPNLIHSCGQ